MFITLFDFPVGYLADISKIRLGLLREPKGLCAQVQDVWGPVWHLDTQQIGGSICPSVSGGHLSLSLSGCDTVNPSWFSVSHLFLCFCFPFYSVYVHAPMRMCRMVVFVSSAQFGHRIFINLFNYSGISLIYLCRFLELLISGSPEDTSNEQLINRFLIGLF